MNVLNIPDELILDWERNRDKIVSSEERAIAKYNYSWIKSLHWMFLGLWVMADFEYMLYSAHYLLAILLRASRPRKVLAAWRKGDFEGPRIFTAIGLNRAATLFLVYDFIKSIIIDDDDAEMEKKLEELEEEVYLARMSYGGMFIYAFGPSFKAFSKLMNRHNRKSEPKQKLPLSTFALQDFDEETLIKTDWRLLTGGHKGQNDGYDPADVFELISFLGKDYDKQMKLMDTIILAARRDLYEFKITESVFNDLMKMKERLSTHPSYSDDEERHKIYQMKESPEFLVDQPETAEEQTPDEEPEDESIPHFPLIGKREKGGELYEDLIVKGFIHRDTKKDCWLYVMGFSTEKPEEFKPINWLASKELARSLIESIYDDVRKEGIVTLKRLEKLVEECFIHKGKKLELNPKKPYTSDMSDKLDKILKDFSDPS